MQKRSVFRERRVYSLRPCNTVCIMEHKHSTKTTVHRYAVPQVTLHNYHQYTKELSYISTCLRPFSELDLQTTKMQQY